MKKLIFLFTILYAIHLVAQTPQGFNYSAVARDASGKPMANRNVRLQMSILKGSAGGAVQYSENHSLTTDAYGLFNLVVGNGAVQSGNLSSINWGTDNYFLKTALDANGGTNFLTMGTTQLLSVPYALHAKKSDNGIDRISADGDTLYLSSGQAYVPATSGSSNSGGFTHFIGEQFGGGVVFYLWKDAQGVEHGLIVDLTDLGSEGEVWSNLADQEIGFASQSEWDGLSNCNAIVNQAGHLNSAAALCLNSTNSGFDDWYLPSILELSLLNQNLYQLNKIFYLIGATKIEFNYPYYSSTENRFDQIWVFMFHNGNRSFESPKSGNNCKIRAIRAF
jgi:hypothetical protein